MGEPGRSEIPREQGVPTWSKDLGSKEVDRFSGGMKPLERRIEALRGFSLKRQSGAKIRKGLWITWEEESFEGRSPRVLRAERGS